MNSHAFSNASRFQVNNVHREVEEDSPLWKAVKDANLDLVRELIKSCRGEINKPNLKGWTLLHEAAARGNLPEIAECLISAGANIDTINGDVVSPLDITCKFGNRTTIQLLIDAGCMVTIKFPGELDYNRSLDLSFFTPHKIEFTSKNSEIIGLLTENNADVNAKDDLGRTPICYAIEKPNIPGVRWLFRARANLFIKDKRGRTPFHCCCASGNLKIFDILKYGLTDKKSINHATPEGYTSLMLACQSKHYDIADELIRLGADTTLTDTSGLLAVHMAARGGPKLLQLLLQHTPKEVIEKYASFRPGLEKWRSLPCVIIESQYFESLKLLYESDLNEAILKCPDKINDHLVSPVVFLLLYNTMGLDKKAKLKFLEFLLSHDFLIDPVYQNSIREEYKKQMWIETIDKIINNPRTISSIEAVVQMHSHFHTDCYCAVYLSVILKKISSPDKILPSNFLRQSALFNESAHEGFIAALDLLRYSDQIEPDDVMESFLRQISAPLYTWSGHEVKVIKFLLGKCVTNFMPLFMDLSKCLISLTMNPNNRRKYAGFLTIKSLFESDTRVMSLKSLSRFTLRRRIRKEAEVASESFHNCLKTLPLPHTLTKYVLYEDDF
ncbi:uncharacterized protein [Halyomorpha halys]|uniref:uncharacterized protein n=1 Tax=Halyomorpha halys TaxID=286706 RepID=UPI0006D51F3A|nr:uncharacterized protein LOC106682839 [Halyomorpha halys]